MDVLDLCQSHAWRCSNHMADEWQIIAWKYKMSYIDWASIKWEINWHYGCYKEDSPCLIARYEQSTLWKFTQRISYTCQWHCTTPSNGHHHDLPYTSH